MPETLRIVTLNTWKNEGDYARRLELMARGLAELSPDVILLQETFCCEATGECTAGYLAKRLGCAMRFAPARIKERLHRGERLECASGLAVLSRLPIRDCWMTKLPSSAEGGERLAFAAELSLGAMHLTAMCVHFSHLKAETVLRQRQIEYALQALRGVRRRMPCIVGGDFNCVPDSEEVLGATRTDETPLVNALPALGNSEPTATFPWAGGTGKPGRQIDQLWLIEEAKPVRLALVGGGVCMNEADMGTGLYPSDHAGVWMDLAIRT